MGGFLWKKGMTFGRGGFFVWGRGSCCNEVGWSALMSCGKAVCRPDCCTSMSGLEITPRGSRVTDGSRSLIGLEFWTNGGGSVIGIGGF